MLKRGGEKEGTSEVKSLQGNGGRKEIRVTYLIYPSHPHDNPSDRHWHHCMAVNEIFR